MQPASTENALKRLANYQKIRDDFANDHDYQKAIQKLMICLWIKEGSQQQVDALYQLLTDLFPKMDRDTHYQYLRAINHFLDKFPNLQREYRLCLTIGLWHQDSRLALGYLGKSLRYHQLLAPHDCQSTLKEVQRFFLRTVCRELIASLKFSYAKQHPNSFSRWIQAVSYFHCRSYPEDDSLIQRGYLKASRCLNQLGKAVHQGFEDFNLLIEEKSHEFGVRDRSTGHKVPKLPLMSIPQIKFSF